MTRTPPKWLSPEAVEVWHRCEKVLTCESDVEAYTLLCVSLAEYRACLSAVGSDRLVPTDRGAMKAHPLIGVAKQHADQAAKLLAKFRMTPVDRGEHAGGDAGDELDDLLSE